MRLTLCVLGLLFVGSLGCGDPMPLRMKIAAFRETRGRPDSLLSWSGGVHQIQDCLAWVSPLRNGLRFRQEKARASSLRELRFKVGPSMLRQSSRRGGGYVLMSKDSASGDTDSGVGEIVSDIPGFLSGMLPEASGNLTEFSNDDVDGGDQVILGAWERGIMDPPQQDPRPAANEPSKPLSALWNDWTEEQVRRSMWLWVNKLVVGLDLCPFALENLTGLRVVVSPATDRDGSLDLITDEMKLISTAPMDMPATTVLVFPQALFDSKWREELSDEAFETEWGSCNWPNNFLQFMHMATESRDLAQQLSDVQGQQLKSENLLLTFHPQSTFSENDVDPADFALRSPFPALLLLRGVDVRRAEERYASQGQTTEDIAIGNEVRLESIGYAQLSEILEEVMKEAKRPKGAPKPTKGDVEDVWNQRALGGN